MSDIDPRKEEGPEPENVEQPLTGEPAAPMRLRAEAPVDCAKAKRELGWQPGPVEDAIGEAALFWVGLRSARP